MKIRILKHDLNESIQHVSKAISSRTTIPILTGIKLEVNFQGMTLTASDTDISIQAFIPAEDKEKQIVQVERPGSVVLPAKFFVEIIKKLPSEEIEMEVQDGFQTFIRSGATDIQMVGLDPEEFPVLPSVEENQVISIPGDLLKNMIRQTVFSISTNETSPILTGVLWNLSDNQFKFVATDRHRLASRVAGLDDAEGARFSNIVIAGKTLNELSKIIPDQNTRIEIVVADNQVLFKIDRVLFYTRILDGTYPDTSKIIPTNYKTELILDTKKLSDSIDRAYLLSREEKTNIVRLQTLEDGSIEISSSSSELGKVTEQMEVAQFTGEPLRISFNSKYMLDVLKVVESEQLHIGFTGAMSPIIIKPVDDTQSLYLILPYRTTH
ncbi:MAG: DNA polymerase III subunit beta [Paenibacillus macerans]|uniref:Beta sliding clamp n=1 Tax=Paenibacillus macerans TaxID=44252 RepID=A0A090ZP13_PAEMA|nr:DNA polymerase III subunit beta [Paenibacillus macerans]KFN12000.1 DNA polymerase III, beta subunit [Paenibacillus macerans]MBS5912371.1 DNA polymerase III subunit beta [Paenibacillus macerans]MCY7559298.1 DNA polymerase III subunit beta [Paenibacillus macerans]MDU5946326.1 DNA polymerase III subunit beta [Paenibacillus macerans]MDU7472146.1 DNA polymerase III subunit beta [Paenibacillus macerans]